MHGVFDPSQADRDCDRLAASADPQALLAAYLRHQTAAVQREAARLLVSTDPESVHAARAPLRRLRAALRFLSPSSREEDRRFRTAARRLSRAMGEIRDLDVFAQDLAGSTTAAFEWTKRRRAAARDRLLEILNSDAFSRGLAAFAGDHLAIPGLPTGPKVARLWRRLRREGMEVGRLGKHARHRLRTRARRLGVALEIFARDDLSSSPGDAGTAFLARLDVFQRRLGDLNDLAVAGRLLREIEDETGYPSSGKVRKALRKRARRVKRRAASAFADTVRAAKAWPLLSPNP